VSGQEEAGTKAAQQHVADGDDDDGSILASGRSVGFRETPVFKKSDD
jgi:hypothetical protein